MIIKKSLKKYNIMKKPIYISLGFISLGLGILGSVLPILPTTPFVLLSAYLFSKSSDRWYQWLIKMPQFGKNIKDWNDNGIISLKAKIICTLTVSTVMIWIIFYSIYPQIVKIIIPIVLSFVLIFVCTRPSRLPDKSKALCPKNL